MDRKETKMHLEKQRVLKECFNDVMVRADNTQDKISEYMDHVWSGGDVTRIPNNDGFKSWYGNPIYPYAQLIVNSYR